MSGNNGSWVTRERQLPIARRAPGRYQALPRRNQSKPQALHLDRRSRRGKTGVKWFQRGPMRPGFFLLAIGFAALLGAGVAAAGTLVEFPNLPGQTPAKLVGYLARPDTGLSLIR